MDRELARASEEVTHHLAYPDVQPEMLEVLAKDQFIDVLFCQGAGVMIISELTTNTSMNPRYCAGA